MQDVAIVIKTFERPDCLVRLLASIQRHGWQGPVLVADDSREPARERILAEFGPLVTQYLVLPFDSGVCVGRNLLLRVVATPFFLLCDDDFVFDDRTDLPHLRSLLEHGDLDLVGGVCYDRVRPSLIGAAGALFRLDWWRLALNLGMEIPRPTCFNFVACGSGLWRLQNIPYTPPVTRCHFVANFFLARTEAVRRAPGGWDESGKTGRHKLFFWQAREMGLRVGHTDEVGVLHLMEWPPGYLSFRRRDTQKNPAIFAPPDLPRKIAGVLATWGRIWRRHRTRPRPGLRPHKR